jgi:hypothetical protein
MRPIPRAPTFQASRRAAAAALATPLRRAAAASVSGSSSAACVAAAARRSSDASAAATNDPNPSQHPSPSISGVWSLHQRDHGVDRVMELWGLPAIARATANRIAGIEISASPPSPSSSAPDPKPQPPHLSVRYLCPVPQFSVREVVPLTGGEPALLRRRDLKPGGCSARARVLSACGGVVSVETSWEGCAMEEVYELVSGEEETLVLRTTLRCRRPGETEEREARAVQVYKRRQRDGGGGGGGGGKGSAAA